MKSEVKAAFPGSTAPIPPPVQHPASPNTGAEKTLAAQRPDASAAQVLQRMDLAGSSGVVQLRADARHLDVGASSGALGWVEVRATTGASGRVDATLRVQNDASAHALSNQSKEISDYAREHSVRLGQVSVGVGTGDSAQGKSRSTYGREGNETPGRRMVAAAQPLADTEQMHHAADAVSLISVRA